VTKVYNKNSLIYKITNTRNNKVYIGKTTSSLKKRKGQYFSESFKTKRNRLINKAIRKHGWDSFSWEILCYCDNLDELAKKEKEFIKKYKSFYKENKSIIAKHGYNMTEGGEGNLGYVWTNEAREKIKGKNNHRFGKKLTKEQREHLKNINLNRKHSKSSISKLKKTLEIYHWNRKNLDIALITFLFFKEFSFNKMTSIYNIIKKENLSNSPFKRITKKIGISMNAKNQNDYKKKQNIFVRKNKIEEVLIKALLNIKKNKQ